MDLGTVHDGGNGDALTFCFYSDWVKASLGHRLCHTCRCTFMSHTDITVTSSREVQFQAEARECGTCYLETFHVKFVDACVELFSL